MDGACNCRMEERSSIPSWKRRVMNVVLLQSLDCRPSALTPPHSHDLAPGVYHVSLNSAHIVQGLDVNARGHILHRPLDSDREAEISRQYSWATQTDTKLASFHGQLYATGDRAAKTAGVSFAYRIDGNTTV